MKRILFALVATAAGVVALFGYRTSLDAVAPAPSADESGASPAPTAVGAGPRPDLGPTPPASTPAATPDVPASGAGDGTYTGAASSTPYGPVRVAIVVTGGRIADVTILQSPDRDARSRSIAERALPILVDETVRAQSARVDLVSGATYTSQGYRASLQSAIDEAGL